MTARLSRVPGADERGRAFGHFATRLAERIGADLDARVMFDGIVELYRREDWARLKFVLRLSRTGRRVFRLDLRDGRRLFVVMDCEAGLPVTVFRSGMDIGRHGGDREILE